MSEKETPIKEESKTSDEITMTDLKTAYIVGITKENKLIFQLFGEDKTLLPLLGLHEHATHCVNGAYNNQQMSGDRLTHEVGLAIADIAKKLDDLTSKKMEHYLALNAQQENLPEVIIPEEITQTPTKIVE